MRNVGLSEIMSELKKIKVHCFDENHKYLSELTKKQKLIFKAFSIDINTINQLPSYNLKWISGY